MSEPQNISQYTHSTPVIFGLAREGYSTYQFLRLFWATKEILLFDDKDHEDLPKKWQKVLKVDKNVQFFTKKSDFFQKIEQTSAKNKLIIFKTPGIPPKHPLIADLQKRHAVFSSNTQLFLETIAELRVANSPPKTATQPVSSVGGHATYDAAYDAPTHKNKYQTPLVIGVTGTKGKSTTTSLIHHTLTSNNFPAVLGGNIGLPPLDLLADWDPQKLSTQIYVLELSSHQLSELTYSPHIAVIQNITPEHLDYYPDFHAYVAAKSHITKYQTPDDVVIYNPNQKLPAELAQMSPGERITFTQGATKNKLMQLVPLTTIPLKGSHNLLNVGPSLKIAELFDISMQQFKKALLSFKPLPHRLEFVGEHHSVHYYNDSLSTTPESTIAALSSFSSGSVILIAGGHERQQDFTELGRRILEHKVKGLILLPTTGQRIKEAVIDAQATVPDQPIPIMKHVSDMSAAVKVAQSLAMSGDVILLSPASASFNLFKDYAERGELFKKAIKK